MGASRARNRSSRRYHKAALRAAARDLEWRIAEERERLADTLVVRRVPVVAARNRLDVGELAEPELVPLDDKPF